MDEPNRRLQDLDFPLAIETSGTDFISDFYVPALRVAKEYKRGVGYFSSSWFQLAASGLKDLANNGGTAKWLISPILNDDDWDALKQGEDARRNPELYSRLDQLITDIEEGLERDTKNTIAWLIADGVLDIKIVETGGHLSGDFHDKWGIITGQQGGKIAFHGSQNDSAHGQENYESYSVFTSWGSPKDAERIEHHESRFDDIWSDNKDGVYAFSLPDSIELDLANLRDGERPYQKPSETTRLTSAYRWRHQEQAISEFLDNGSGILDMATGTGKTRTALKIMNRLLRRGEIDNIVVATFGNDLLTQWYEKLLTEFEAKDLLIYRQFGGQKQMGSFLMGSRRATEALIISYDHLGELIDGAGGGKLERSLLICDEVHNMGSEKRREALTGKLDNFPYRLGLSATPMDPYNETRNEFLIEEVGPVVFEFGLKDAIKRGILCELNYIPLTYSLSEEDKEEQRAQFKKFKALKQQDPTISKTQLYIMLARIRKASEEKLPEFREYIEKNPEILENCLIFVETMDYGTKVQEIIHDHTVSYRTYYGVDDESNLDDFSNEDISVLVTSRAISEGIDIKSVRNIILFTSDRSKGTTIQRVGRALRRDPTDPGKVANVVDFVVSEDINYDPEDDPDARVPPDYERYEWFKKIDDIKQEE